MGGGARSRCHALKHVGRFLAVLCLHASFARAHVTDLADHRHEPGATYTAIAPSRTLVRVLYTVPEFDLERIDGEGRAPADHLDRVAAGMSFENLGAACRIVRSTATDYDAIGAYQYTFDFACPDPPDDLTFRYVLFDGDAAHANFTEIVLGDEVSHVTLDASSRTLDIPVTHLVWLRGVELPLEPPALPGAKPALVDYLRLGFAHVVTGFDHLAFVLALILLATRLRDVVVPITAFTVAHSLTLGLAATGVWVLPARVVEPLIAVSIVVVAVENVVALWRRPANAWVGDAAARARGWLTAFAFGLVHGFGFAALLRTIGLPAREFLVSLAAFNVGVELAQLAVVVLPFLLMRHLLQRTATYRAVASVASSVIAALGALWLVERLAAA